MTTTASLDLDCRWNINETTARHPATLAVLDAHGIDTCGGGTESVEDAARQAQVDARQHCAALDEAMRTPG